MASSSVTVNMIGSVLLYYVGGLLGCYIVITITAAALVASFQEAKIWRPPNLPSLTVHGHIKVFTLNVIWMTYCLIGSIFICIKWILSCGTSDIQQDAYQYVEKPAAQTCIRVVVGNAQVIGTENLPPPLSQKRQIPAPVYIANHASQIDAAVAYFFNRRFKWIAKKSILYLPGVGQLMALGGHVLINRKTGRNTKSVSNLYTKSDAAVQSGIPMFIFAQGTRRMDKKLPFKDGAFVVAETNKTKLIPISIDIPKDAWNSWYPLSLLWTSQCPKVTITIHKPVPYDSNQKRDAVKKQCETIIYSSLPSYMYGGDGSDEVKDKESDKDK